MCRYYKTYVNLPISIFKSTAKGVLWKFLTTTARAISILTTKQKKNVKPKRKKRLRKRKKPKKRKKQRKNAKLKSKKRLKKPKMQKMPKKLKKQQQEPLLKM